MKKEQVMQKLTAPFTKDVAGKEFPDIYWRITQGFEDASSPTKRSCLVVAYIDARHVYNRLNSVLGADWHKNLIPVGDGANCRLSLKIEGEWIDRDGMAGATKIEPEKGKDSKAVVRAAVAWGIGTYLYDIPQIKLPSKILKINGSNKAQEVAHTSDGKSMLIGKNILSDYINVNYSIPLVKLTEVASIMSEEDKQRLGEPFKVIWEYYAKKIKS